MKQWIILVALFALVASTLASYNPFDPFNIYGPHGILGGGSNGLASDVGDGVHKAVDGVMDVVDSIL